MYLDIDEMVSAIDMAYNERAEGCGCSYAYVRLLYSLVDYSSNQNKEHTEQFMRALERSYRVYDETAEDIYNASENDAQELCGNFKTFMNLLQKNHKKNLKKFVFFD